MFRIAAKMVLLTRKRLMNFRNQNKMSLMNTQGKQEGMRMWGLERINKSLEITEVTERISRNSPPFRLGIF